MNVHEINLDVSKQPAVTPVLHLGQGDKNGTTLQASIYDDSSPLPLAGKSVRFAMRSPNGLAYYEVNGTVSGNVATFQINEEYAANIAGMTDVAYVEVLEGSTVICSTNRFRVVVLQSAQDGADPAQAWTNGVKEFLEDAQEQIDAAVDEAEDAAADAHEAADEAREAAGGTIPLMSSTMRGGAKLGSGLSMDGEALNLGNLVESASGAEVVTDGCAIYSVEGEGWSEQETTTGKNLLPTLSITSNNGITMTRNPDGSVHVKGTASATITPNAVTVHLTPGQYVLSKGTSEIQVVTGIQINGSASVCSGASYLMNVETEADYKFNVRISSGVQIDETWYPQLELGSTATSYEPYSGGAPSPSPDYPQEIEVARGRNLLDFSQYENKTSAGISYVNSVDGIHVSGTSTAQSFNITNEANVAKLATIKAGSYVISFDSPRSASITVNVFEYTSAGTRVSLTNGYKASGTTFTVDHEANVYCVVYIPSGRTVDFTLHVQLELGSTPSPYVPYGHVGLDLEVTPTLYKDGYAIPANGVESANAAFKIVATWASYDSCILSVNQETSNTSRLHAYDSSGKWLAQVASLAGPASTVASIPADTSELRLSTPKNATFSITSTTPIPLPAKGFAASLPDGTADALTVDSAGRWEWVNVCDEVNATNASVTFANSNANRSKFSLISNAKSYGAGDMPSMLGNRWVATKDNATWMPGCCGISSAGVVNVGVSPSITTAQGFIESYPDFELLYPLATPTTEHGYIDLPELPEGATVSIPELRQIGCSWFIAGVDELAQHAANWGKRALASESRIAALEAAVAELATS